MYHAKGKLRRDFLWGSRGRLLAGQAGLPAKDQNALLRSGLLGRRASTILAHAKAAFCRLCSGCRPIPAQFVSAGRIQRVPAGDLPGAGVLETSRLRREAWAYPGTARSEAGPHPFSALPALWSCLSERRCKLGIARAKAPDVRHGSLRGCQDPPIILRRAWNKQADHEDPECEPQQKQHLRYSPYT